MERIPNTSKQVNKEWLFGGNPRAIEEQEAEGQRKLAASSQLPKYVNDYGRKQKLAKEYYESLGIKVIGDSKSDDLFVDVELPEGWQIKPTDHAMWSNLIDKDGVDHGSIFYKAAFYDRDAFINPKTEV